MNTQELFGLIGGVLLFIAYLPYLWEMVKGTTRPNIVSYILWTLLQGTAIAALLSVDFSWSILLLVSTTIGNLLVIALCLFGYGYKKYGTIDIICFCIGILAIVGWFVTNEPEIAVVFTVIATFVAIIPTLIKEYSDPGSEYAPSWFLTALASTFGLLAVTGSALNFIFPTYYVIEGSVVGLLALRKKKRRRRK